MGIQSDRWIRDMARTYQMIEPFVDHHVREGISYGLSSYGYDVRLAPEFQILGDTAATLDPKQVTAQQFLTIAADSLVIPAGGYCLGRTIEYFRIPRGVLTICCGKSTYARCGVAIHVTPFEPEWEGHATIAIANCAGRPARIYANEGIGQVIFLAAAEGCEISYADRRGKYQGQRAITPARAG